MVEDEVVVISTGGVDKDDPRDGNTLYQAGGLAESPPTLPHQQDLGDLGCVGRHGVDLLERSRFWKGAARRGPGGIDDDQIGVLAFGPGNRVPHHGCGIGSEGMMDHSGSQALDDGVELVHLLGAGEDFGEHYPGAAAQDYLGQSAGREGPVPGPATDDEPDAQSPDNSGRPRVERTRRHWSRGIHRAILMPGGSHRQPPRGTPSVPSSAIDGWDWAACAALAVLALAVCLVHLGSRGISASEASSVHIAQRTGFHGVLADGGEMVVYYLFLKVWTILGRSEWVVRLPSAIFAAGSVALLYLLVRRLFDRWVALLAGLLLVVNASFVRYGQFARGFTLEMLAIVASWLVLSIALERGRWGWFVLYGLLAALAVAAHPFGLFFLAAQAASLLLLPPRSVPWRGVLTGFAVAAIAITPVVVAMAIKGSGQIAWIPPLSGSEIRNVLMFLGPTSPSLGSASWVLGVYLLAWVAGLAVIVRRITGLGRSMRAWSYGVAAMWLLVPILGAAAASAALHPLMVPRYFVGVLPASALLLAVVLSSVPWRPGVAVGACGFAVLGVSVVAGSYHTGDEGWRNAETYVFASARPGDGVVFAPTWVRDPFEYYWELDHPRGAPVPLNPPAPWEGLAYRDHSGQPAVRIADAAAPRSRVWVVTTDPVFRDRSHRMRARPHASKTLTFFLNRVARDFRVGSGRKIGEVSVFLLERSPPAATPQPTNSATSGARSA